MDISLDCLIFIIEWRTIVGSTVPLRTDAVVHVLVCKRCLFRAIGTHFNQFCHHRLGFRDMSQRETVVISLHEVRVGSCLVINKQVRDIAKVDGWTGRCFVCLTLTCRHRDPALRVLKIINQHI